MSTAKSMGQLYMYSFLSPRFHTATMAVRVSTLKMAALAAMMFFGTLFLLQSAMVNPLSSPGGGIFVSDSGVNGRIRNPEDYRYCSSIAMPKLIHMSPRMPYFLEDMEKMLKPGETMNSTGAFASIVFITKRPGGYDVLLNSLALQKDMRFEVIIVDELAQHRADDIIRYAESVGVKYISVMPGKPFPPKYRNHPFGIANALNTGFLLTRAPVIFIVMDYAWVPDNLLERTLGFYADKKERQNHLLSYPETHFGASNHFESMLPDWVHKNDLLTIFKTPVCIQPSLKQEGINWGGFFSRPEDLIKDPKRRDFEKQVPPWFWELSAATMPWNLLRPLNGVDERLDVGDDCHEANMRQRAEIAFKTETWSDGGLIVEQLFHRFQEDPEMWSRSAKNTNLFGLHGQLLEEVSKGGQLAAPNDFDLGTYRDNGCIDWYYRKFATVTDVSKPSSLKKCSNIS